MKLCVTVLLVCLCLCQAQFKLQEWMTCLNRGRTVAQSDFCTWAFVNGTLFLDQTSPRGTFSGAGLDAVKRFSMSLPDGKTLRQVSTVIDSIETQVYADKPLGQKNFWQDNDNPCSIIGFNGFDSCVFHPLNWPVVKANLDVFVNQDFASIVSKQVAANKYPAIPQKAFDQFKEVLTAYKSDSRNGVRMIASIVRHDLFSTTDSSLKGTSYVLYRMMIRGFGFGPAAVSMEPLNTVDTGLI